MLLQSDKSEHGGGHGWIWWMDMSIKNTNLNTGDSCPSMTTTVFMTTTMVLL